MSNSLLKPQPYLRDVYPWARYALEPFVIHRMRHELTPSGNENRKMWAIEANDALVLGLGFIFADITRRLGPSGNHADWVEPDDAKNEVVAYFLQQVREGKFPRENVNNIYLGLLARGVLTALARRRQSENNAREPWSEQLGEVTMDEYSSSELDGSSAERDSRIVDSTAIGSPKLLFMEQLLSQFHFSEDEVYLICLHAGGGYIPLRLAYGHDADETDFLLRRLPQTMLSRAKGVKTLRDKTADVWLEWFSGRSNGDVARLHRMTPGNVTQLRDTVQHAICDYLRYEDHDPRHGAILRLLDELQSANGCLRYHLAADERGPQQIAPTKKDMTGRTSAPTSGPDPALELQEQTLAALAGLAPGKLASDQLQSLRWFIQFHFVRESLEDCFTAMERRLEGDAVSRRERVLDALHVLAPFVFQGAQKLRGGELKNSEPAVDL